MITLYCCRQEPGSGGDLRTNRAVEMHAKNARDPKGRTGEHWH